MNSQEQLDFVHIYLYIYVCHLRFEQKDKTATFSLKNIHRGRCLFIWPGRSSKILLGT